MRMSGTSTGSAPAPRAARPARPTARATASPGRACRTAAARRTSAGGRAGPPPCRPRARPARPACARERLGQLAERAVKVCWSGSVPFKMIAAPSRGRGRGDEGIEHLRQLRRARVADDRAIQLRKAGPIDPRLGAAAVFVAADEGQGVAAAGIGDRDAGVGRARRSPPGRRAPPRTESAVRAGTAPRGPPGRTRTGRPT